MKRICVLGLGYMGLPMAGFLTKVGYNVLGVDINKKKALEVNKGICPFSEPGLADLVKTAHKSGRLQATNQIEHCDVYIISVPTPKKGNRAELKFVDSATRMIATVMQEGDLVILESTVSPNTCKNLMKPILDKKVKKYYLAHCPERAIPGRTLHEMIHNDRIIGGIDQASTLAAKNIYQKFIKGKIHLTDITTAECCKLMENTFRDVNIALANDYAKVAEELGINIYEAIKLANLHPRVNIHQPGPGVGGHCIAIDPWFLVENTKNGDLIRLSRRINDGMPDYVVNKIIRLMKKFNCKKVAILGVAYKKNVDDARETPAEHVICGLLKKKISIKITDPYVIDFPYKLDKLPTVLKWCDLAVVITDHDDYRKITWQKNKNIKVVFDTRDVIKKSEKIIKLSDKI